MAEGMLFRAIDAKKKRKKRLDVQAQKTGMTGKGPVKSKATKTLDPTKPTAKTPKGVHKTKKKGNEELRKLREKQRRRAMERKKKQGGLRQVMMR